MPRQPRETDVGFFVGLGIVVLVLLAALPLVLRFDAGHDRMRPMYVDVETMAELQTRHIEANGTGVPADLGPGESILVGGQTFTTSPGTTLQVTTSEGGYCVQASNEYGDSTQPRCGNGETTRR